MTKRKKIAWTVTTVLIIGLIALIYFKFFFVFGEGVKTGQLNYAVRKGNMFKTYEGKIIQTGFKSKTVGMIQSYEFEFSIKNKRIFEILEQNSGKVFDLHYKEYHGVVPWRGHTVYVVDSIMGMRDE